MSLNPTERTTPTEAEKIVLAAYVKDFKSRGFCKLSNSASAHTQLFNRFTKITLPLSFIDPDFTAWLRAEGKVCEFKNDFYIIRTLPHIVGSKFIPISGAPYYTEPRSRCTYVNTYRAYEPSASPIVELSPLFTEFFERLAPDKVERDMFLQYLAHMFQRPAERPSWHIMLTSFHGTGKGFLLEKILNPLLHHTSVVSTYGKLTGQFSTILEDNLLVLLDDCTTRSEAQQTTIKSILTEERAFVEHKFAQGGMVPTYTRFILASNEQKPLDLEPGDRRWFVLKFLEHRHNIKETALFIKDLADALDQPGMMDAVHRYFLTLSLNGFNHKHVYQTETLLKMIGMSRGIHSDLLQDFIADNPVFTTKEWMTECDDQKLPRPNLKAIPKLLEEFGYVNTQKMIRKDRIKICHPAGWDIVKIVEAYPEVVTFSCNGSAMAVQ